MKIVYLNNDGLSGPFMGVIYYTISENLGILKIV